MRNLYLAENAVDSLAEFLLYPQGYSSLWQRLLQKEHPHHPILSQRWELPAGDRGNMLVSVNCLRFASQSLKHLISLPTPLPVLLPPQTRFGLTLSSPSPLGLHSAYNNLSQFAGPITFPHHRPCHERHPHLKTARQVAGCPYNRSNMLGLRPPRNSWRFLHCRCTRFSTPLGGMLSIA